ncbi:MAG: DUF4374 domain-containing protein, partial [Flavobacteriaceae bacterium]|nr:DUF4374 domain-containing protein [Flavobacteriaceae bacterium]
MKKNNILKNVGILALGLFTLASCSNDDSDGNNGISEGTAHKKFFVATSDAESKASYLLAVDDLESGTVTIKGQGIENPYAFSAFISNGTRTITAMQYRQGDPSVGLSYGLNSDGKLVKAGGEFQLPKGYGTWGTFGDYAIASRSGQTLSIGEGKTATGAIFYFIDQKNKNAVSERTIVTDNIAGNGQTATFCGIVDIGNGEFLTSLVLAKGALSGGGGATTATVEYPDSVWIAKMDINLNVKHIYRDDRISYSSGRFRSSYIPQIGNDDKGNTYVFS